MSLALIRISNFSKDVRKKIKFGKHNLPESTNMGNSSIKDGKFLIFLA